jgi:sarcosine oxidase
VESWDAIVVGLGAAGSAALYQLAKRGVRVLGIDRFDPPHEAGSSHGDTRITRLAIGEGEVYVPLALRTYELWREVESLTDRSLLVTTGGLWISSAARRAETHVAHFFRNTLAAARQFRIRHEILTSFEMRHRFPQFEVAANEIGYYEPQAGYVRPEACVGAHLALAASHGAAIHPNEAVLEITESRGVTVRTDRGVFSADRVILCVGAWVQQFLPPEHARLFTVTRQVLHWFETRGPIEDFQAPAFPVFIWELQRNRNVIYGCPAIDGRRGGLKVATEMYDEAVDPDSQARRTVSTQEERTMYEDLVEPYIPGVGPRCVKSVACLYTATPDFHFVIDRHPLMERVIVSSACSGHGFKHSAAIGEALADLATGKTPRVDLAPFSWDRFGLA